MSKYTTQVRFICETAAGESESKGYNNLDETLEAGRNYIFDFTYPLFDPLYKSVLETKILKHFYTREISEETVGLWKLRLNARMNEIMPFYNKMYESELLAFNPFYDVDYTREGNRKGNQTTEETSANTVTDQGLVSGSMDDNRSSRENSLDYQNAVRRDTGTEARAITGNTTESSTDTRNTLHSGSDVETTTRDNLNDRWDYYSDTPQGTIGFIPGSEGEPQAQGALENQTYLTNVRHIHDDTTGSSEGRTTEYGHSIGENGSGSRQSGSTGSDILTLNTAENTENTGTSEKSGSEQNHRQHTTTDTRNTRTSSLNSGNAKNLEEYTEQVSGKMGTTSYSKLLKEFRETFLNIDMLVIDNLQDLFFGLWE